MSNFVFTHVSGYSFRRRALGFLQRDGSTELDAKAHFEELVEKDANLVRSRFGHWLEGKIFDKYFHGWSDEQYRQCFVFKWEKRHKPQRLYGFLCHPNPSTDKGFLLCVLAYFATKDDATDYTILDRLNKLRQDFSVISAISAECAEFMVGKSKWNH